MSENVEVVRRVTEAINRRDLDAAVADFSERFELDFSNSRSPISGIYRGPSEAKDMLASFLEPWDSVEFDPGEEITELEDGLVLTVNAVRARGTGSGVEVAAAGAMLWRIRDGQVLAAKMFQSRAEALEAAG